MDQDVAKTTVAMTLVWMMTMHCLIHTMRTCLWMRSLGSKRGSSQMRDGHGQAQPLVLGQGQHARHDPLPLAPITTASTTATMTTV